MPKPNIELLEEVYEYIRTHRKEWDQEVWVCRTAACFAGQVCLLSGARRVTWDGAIFDSENDHSLHSEAVKLRNGHLVDIRAYATKKLGLMEAQANRLFMGTNRLRDIRRIIDKLKADPNWDPYK